MPTISGTVAVGKTLTANYDVAQFSPVPDDTSVTWLVGDVEVGSGATYLLTPSDRGKTVSVRLGARATGYDDLEVYSDPTAAVAYGTQSFTPKISGAAAVGTTLKVTGLPAGATFTYKWKRNGATISGGTKSTYKLTSTDVGKKITVTVTSKRTAYKTLTKTSAATAAVKKSFSKSYTPRISGTAKVGQKLKATVTAWSPKATFKYQWYRNGVAISGSTASTRTLNKYDLGAVITVKVTGSKSGYYTLAKTSAGTAVVAKGSIAVKTPVITGTMRVGNTLKATAYTATPSSAVKTYQWYRNGVAVAGKTGSTYLLRNVDAGKKITVKVTYTVAGYNTRTLTSAATTTIAKRSASMTKNTVYSPDKSLGVFYVAPGIYFTDNATAGCMWVRDNDFDASNGWITSYTGAARWIVQIYSTDKIFFTDECGSWYKYDGTGAEKTTITKDGMYGVGVDVKAGLYQQSGAMDGCFVTAEINASNEPGAIVEDYEPSAGEILALDPSWAPFFTTWGCGTWTWVGPLEDD